VREGHGANIEGVAGSSERRLNGAKPAARRVGQQNAFLIADISFFFLSFFFFRVVRVSASARARSKGHQAAARRLETTTTDRRDAHEKQATPDGEQPCRQFSG
jgi:hypothetical protein